MDQAQLFQAPLPLPASLIHGESLRGYFCRLAMANKLPSVRVLMLGLNLAQFSEVGYSEVALANAEKISFALSLDVETLKRVIPQYSGAQKEFVDYHGLLLREHFVARKHRRVSPAALAISPHHRAAWQISCLSFCGETWDVLIDRCPDPECAKPLTWRAPAGVEYCEHCGFDLRGATALKVAPELREVLRFAVDLFGADPVAQGKSLKALSPNLQTVSPGTLLELAYLFGRSDFRARGDGRFYNKRHEILYPAEFAVGTEILRSYPKSIEDRAGDFDGFKLPPFIAALKSIIKSGFGPETVRVVEGILRQYDAGLKTPTQRLAQARKRNDLLSLREAAKILKVSRADLRRLTDQGLIGFDYVKGDARKIGWYRLDDTEQLASELADKIAIEHIASKTGLPQWAVGQVIDQGLLRRHPSQAVQLVFADPFIRYSEFVEFRARVSAALQPASNEETERVSLSHVFAAIGARGKPWGALLKLALDGGLPGGLRARDLEGGRLNPKNLTIAVTDFYDLLAGRLKLASVKPSEACEMSQLEAQEFLNCLPNDLKVLLDQGHIKRVAPGATKVRRSDVSDIGKAFISAAEIAARADISPLRVAKWARARRLQRHPQSFPFWPRAEVERCLPPVWLSGDRDEDMHEQNRASAPCQSP